jgi:hypothetical protein
VVERTAFVNWRNLQVGERAVPAFSFYKDAEPGAAAGDGDYTDEAQLQAESGCIDHPPNHWHLPLLNARY